MTPESTILVASDSSADAELVRKILSDEFDKIFLSTDSEEAAADFGKYRPRVLILAFDSLEKAERHYLGLYRHSAILATQPHRTLVLCNKNEVRRAYELCCKDHFDDYVLFWPATHDAFRLRMSVRHALRDIERELAGLSTAAMAVQARRVAELEDLLRQSLSEGAAQTEIAARQVREAGAEIYAALDGFSHGLADGRLSEDLGLRGTERLQQELSRLKTEKFGPYLGRLDAAVAPVGAWLDSLQRDVEPHLESARLLKALAENVRPLLLIVDDDELQRKLMARIFTELPYDLAFAESGSDALNMLRKLRPDLILLDLAMPGIDGLETLRRLKSVPQFAPIPVMMITGRSEKEVVVECLKAGAVDFAVKPPSRPLLLQKVARFLGR